MIHILSHFALALLKFLLAIVGNIGDGWIEYPDICNDLDTFQEFDRKIEARRVIG